MSHLITVSESYLTTKDNPFSYFDQYDEWLAFDEDKGYFTNALVARLMDERPVSKFYSNERVVDILEQVYFDIVEMMPDIYELRSA